MFSRIALAKMIDHSVLRPDATEDDILHYCDEAREYHFACVLVLPYWCHTAEKRLRGSDPLRYTKPDRPSMRARQRST
jgi:deoxyribose-phosphate aldolase